MQNGLNAEDLEVCKLVRQGLTDLEIAKVLGVSVHRVKKVNLRIRNKLRFDNRVQIAVWYETQQLAYTCTEPLIGEGSTGD